MQRVEACCNVMQRSAAQVRADWGRIPRVCRGEDAAHQRHMNIYTLQFTAAHCNTLQNTATHCNTLQHNSTHCNTGEDAAHNRYTKINTLQHNATHCNTGEDAAHHTYLNVYAYVYICIYVCWSMYVDWGRTARACRETMIWR